MGIFDRLFRREVAVKKSSSGANIRTRTVSVYDPTTAMKLAAVYSAVELLSSTVAKLPSAFYRYNKAKGIFVRDNDSSLDYLVARQPNNHLTPYQFWKGVVIEIKLRGNAYVLPVYNGTEARELLLLSPNTVAFDKYTMTYTVNDPLNSVAGTFGPSQILHFKNTSLDGGFTGVSTITYAANSMALQATGDAETLQRFAQGGTFKAIYSNDNSVRGFGEYTDKALEEGAEDIQEKLNSGLDIIAVSGDGKIQPLSMSSVDLQYLDNRKFGIREICRFFRVPPSKIYDDFNNTYNAGETANVEFLTDSIDPILCDIEQELNSKLIHGAPNVRMGYCFKFDRDKLFTTNLLSKADYQAKTIANGTYTVNEWRLKENKPAVEGGDVSLISCNVAPINSPKISGET